MAEPISYPKNEYGKIVSVIGEYAESQGFLLPNPGFVDPECSRPSLPAGRQSSEQSERQTPKK